MGDYVGLNFSYGTHDIDSETRTKVCVGGGCTAVAVRCRGGGGGGSGVWPVLWGWGRARRGWRAAADVIWLRVQGNWGFQLWGGGGGGGQ